MLQSHILRLLLRRLCLKQMRETVQRSGLCCFVCQTDVLLCSCFKDGHPMPVSVQSKRRKNCTTLKPSTSSQAASGQARNGSKIIWGFNKLVCGDSCAGKNILSNPFFCHRKLDVCQCFFFFFLTLS